MNLRWPESQPVLGDDPVILRGWRSSDAQMVYEDCQDETLQEFTTVPSPYTMADAEEFVTLGPSLWQAHTGANFAITDPADAVIGAISLQNFNEPEASCEVGYWVADFARGQRVARRAVELIVGWGRVDLGLARLILKIRRENTASIAAALAAGATPTGVTVDEEARGVVHNFGIYEI